MNKKKALQIISRYTPCAHNYYDDSLGFGKTYAKCYDCGETFLIARYEERLKTYREFDDAIDYLSNLEETKRPPTLAREVGLGSKYLFQSQEVEIISYSKQGNQVVVVENFEGKLWCVNINDIIDEHISGD